MQDRNTERRRAPRAAVDIPIHLSDKGSPQGSRSSAKIVNISTSGLLCHFDSALSEMTLVGIDLEIPGLSTPAHIQGAVVRCAKVPDISPATYEVGIFYTDMSDDTRAAIHRFVDRQLAAQA